MQEGRLLSHYAYSDTLHVVKGLRGGAMKVYQPRWTRMYREDRIIADRSSVYLYFCTYCNKNNRLGEDGKKAIDRHIDSAIHQRNKRNLVPDWVIKYQYQVNYIVVTTMLNNSVTHDSSRS